MNLDSNYTEQEITRLYTQYVDMVYRICFMLLKNEADTEDAVQAVFIKVMEKDITFHNSNHEKAWFIVTAQNHCKNQLKNWWQKRTEFQPDYHDSIHQDEKSELLELVMKLPEKYKLPIYLYYYEGYRSDEIAQILELNASTLRSRLKKGRELLKLTLGGNPLE
ncbi:MAG: RNA polymerase sigma factor [Cellulosilyticaceae bacterium]